MAIFAPGDFLPTFIASSSVNPQFAFNTVAGRQFVIVFLGSAQSEIGRQIAHAIIAEADWMRERRILVYLVTIDPRDQKDGPLADLPERYTAFWDFDQAIHRSYRMVVSPPASAPDAMALRIGALVVRENLRLHAWVSAHPAAGFVERLRGAAGTMPGPEAPRQAGRHAPVLTIPDVIDRDHCRRLIDYYEARGGSESGFMRDVGGQTRGIMDDRMKRRRDCYIEDPAFVKPLFQALQDRVVPEIRKAFGFRATRVERYVIGCYDESDHGFFRAHRDNLSKGTAHRAFAMSLNLNSEEYEGGHLTFPEYGSALYKPDTGGAVVFSCSLLHEALPVARGRRYVVLPFLYDERGAAIRAENRKFLDTAASPAAPAGDVSAA